MKDMSSQNNLVTKHEESLFIFQLPGKIKKKFTKEIKELIPDMNALMMDCQELYTAK